MISSLAGAGGAIGLAWVSTGVFGVTVAAALVVMFRAGRPGRGDAGADAGRPLAGPWGGAVITGDVVSGASLLGVAGAVAVFGLAGLGYAVGFLVGWLVALRLAGGPLRDAGLFTMGDVLSMRTRQPPVRAAAAISTLVVSFVCLVAEVVGAGVLISLMAGVPSSSLAGQTTVIAAVGLAMTGYLLTGGVKGTAGVQVIKVALLFAGMAAIGAGVLVRFGLTPAGLLSALDAAGARGAGTIPGAGQQDATMAGTVDRISLGLALVAGGVGLPHILPRLSTAPGAASARRAVAWATWLIGLLLLLALVAGNGAAAMVPRDTADPSGRTNSALPLLGLALGGPLGLGLICAVVFVGIVASAGALMVNAAAACAHDLYPKVIGSARAGPRIQARMARHTAVALGLVATGVAIAARNQDIVFLLGLAFALAASAHLPTICYSLWWRRFTTSGALWSIYGGLAVAVVMIVFSPTVSGTPESMVPGASFAVFGLTNPALVSVPISFGLGYLGTVIARAEPAGAAHPSTTVPTSRRRRPSGVLLLAGLSMLVVAGLAVTGTMVYQQGTRASDGQPLSPAAAARPWLAANAASGPVLTDDEFRADLLRAGWDPRRVVTPASCTADTCPRAWLVVTPTLRTGLSGGGAVDVAIRDSTPVALFGTGDDQVEIRHPSALTAQQAAAELRTRTRVGQALSRLPRVAAEPEVRDLLDNGRADPRVVAMLATLTQRGTVRVLGLPAVPGEDAAGQPRRQLLLAPPPGGAGVLTRFFAVQDDPYRPTSVTPAPGGLLVGYPPVAPPNLLEAFDGP